MGLIQRLRGLASRNPDGSMSGVLRFGGGTTYSATAWDFTRIANSVYSNPTGYRCVENIATNMSRPPWEVRKPGDPDETPIENHPLLDVLNRPDPRTSGTMMMRTISRDMELTGKSFWVKMQGDDPMSVNGPLTGLVRLPPQRMTVVGDADDDLIGFIYTDRNGARQAALPESVLYLRYPHPERDYDGLAPALIAGLPSETDSAAARYNYDLLANDSGMPGYMSVDGLTPEQFREWKAAWESGEYAGKTRFMSGTASYVAVGQTNQQLTYHELRLDSRTDICFAFGWPMVLIDPTHTTFSNMAEARGLVWQQTILPKLGIVWDEMTVQLGLDQGVDVAGDLDDIEELSRNEADIVKEEVSLVDIGVHTVNEAREKLNLGPVPWGDIPHYIRGTLLGTDPPGIPPVPIAQGIPEGTSPKMGSQAADVPETKALDAGPDLTARMAEGITARLRSQSGKSLSKALDPARWWDGARWARESDADLSPIRDALAAKLASADSLDAAVAIVTEHFAPSEEDAA